jgi:hypothetical protein
MRQAVKPLKFKQMPIPAHDQINFGGNLKLKKFVFGRLGFYNGVPQERGNQKIDGNDILCQPEQSCFIPRGRAPSRRPKFSSFDPSNAF